jgi:hypothetical protein
LSLTISKAIFYNKFKNLPKFSSKSGLKRGSF